MSSTPITIYPSTPSEFHKTIELSKRICSFNLASLVDRLDGIHLTENESTISTTMSGPAHYGITGHTGDPPALTTTGDLSTAARIPANLPPTIYIDPGE